jgi:tetratricopeptide (TPR) repeat protein
VYRSSGREALALAQEAEAIYRGLGASVPSSSVAEAVVRVGNALLELKKFDEAADIYSEAIELQKESNFPFLTDTYRTQGNIYFEIGKYEQALQSYLQGIQVNEVDGDEDFMGMDFYNAGRCSVKLNDWQAAVSYFERAREIEKERKALKEVAKVEYFLGSSYLKLERIESAEKSARNYYAIAELRKDNELLCWGGFLKAKVLTAQGDFEAAGMELSSADYLASLGSDWELILEIQSEYQKLYLNMNHVEDAGKVAARIAIIREILE